MPLCRLTGADGAPQYALYKQGEVCPLGELTDDVPVGAELFARGPEWVASLSRPPADRWQPAPDRLLSPVPPPEKVICIGLNYLDHAVETGAEPPSEPVVFGKFNTAIIGHGDAIRLPRVAHQVDYEAELVVVIGTGGKEIPKESAMDHVFGYTCGHDVSARDWQKGRPGGQWLVGKSFDTFAPLGPCLVTRRELDDPGRLRVRMHVNDETLQDSSTAQFIFNIPTLIEHLSTLFTLTPGDLIFTGTPPGVGAARKPPRFLKAGDVCSVEIEGIGTLTNRCEAG